MYFALVYYPEIEHEGFHSFRKKYEPYSALLPEHVPFVFPTPQEIGRKHLEKHIENVLNNWAPFRVHFCTIEISWDHWMYLGVKEGKDKIIQLHDVLYEGILSPYLRKDLPFYPHIGIGLFSKENYDFNNPTAKLTLDTTKYFKARKEFEDLEFDLWCEIDQLNLVHINSDFSKCIELNTFKIGGNKEV